MSPALRMGLRGLSLLLLCALGAFVLTGCGGGGDQLPDEPTPRVNCALQPVVCR